MKVRLESSSSLELAEFIIDWEDIPPSVIIWDNRVFVRLGEALDYQESTVYHVGPTDHPRRL